MFTNSNVNVTSSNLYNVQGSYHSYVHRRTGLGILDSYIAEGALHNSGERFDPPKCHPKTRTAVLRKIENWIKSLDPSSPAMMWLYGSAGVGKSAIAQTVAEMCYDSGFLIASFFFSRNSPGRSDAKRLIATIAYQLALSIPEARADIERAVENDPFLMSKSLDTQFHTLIATPLINIVHKSPSSSLQRLIILDGLDECDGSTTQCTIINLFSNLVKENRHSLLVLFACRPEYDIRNTFNRHDISNLTDHIALDDDISSDDDIAMFLQSKFTEIQEAHPMHFLIQKSWPSPDVINTLVAKSSGQFIYASTVIEYIKSADHRPNDRLDIVLGIVSAGDETPFSELDAIYKHILSTAHNIDLVLRILSILVFSDPTIRYERITYESSSDSTIQCEMINFRSSASDLLELFLGIDKGDMFITLKDMHSILDIPPANRAFHDPVRIRHASLVDFLTDRKRSQTYFLDCTIAHGDLALSCIKHGSNREFDNMLEWFSTERVAFMYATEALVLHCSKTDFSEKLFDSLLTFDFLGWVKDLTGSRLEKEPSILFQWLERWKTHARGREVYDHYTGLLDQYFRSQLEDPVYLDIVYRRVLLSPAACFPFMEGTPWYKYAYQWDALCILHPKNNKEYIELFRNFITDPQRAGRFVATGDVYATTTIELVSQLIAEYWRQQGKSDLNQYIRFNRNVIADRLPDMLAKSSPSQKLYDILTVYLRLAFDKSFITAVIQEAMYIYLERFNHNANLLH